MLSSIWGKKAENVLTALMCHLSYTKPQAWRPPSWVDWKGFFFSLPALWSNKIKSKFKKKKKGGVFIHCCCPQAQQPMCWAALLLGDGVLDLNWHGEFFKGRWEWVVWVWWVAWGLCIMPKSVSIYDFLTFYLHLGAVTELWQWYKSSGLHWRLVQFFKFCGAWMNWMHLNVTCIGCLGCLCWVACVLLTVLMLLF